MDIRLKTSGDVACSTFESGTPENMGIAVGISSIAALEPEICWGVILPPRLPLTSCKKKGYPGRVKDVVRMACSFNLHLNHCIVIMVIKLNNIIITIIIFRKCCKVIASESLAAVELVQLQEGQWLLAQLQLPVVCEQNLADNIVRSLLDK